MNLFKLFAMLLMVTQAPVPVPRQASNSPATSSGQTNTQSKGHDAPPDPSMAVVQPVTTPEGQDANRDHTKGNAAQTVIVRELPAVSISKDWADREVWWFSLFLAIFGGLQALYVAKTLSAIKEQGKSLRRQNDMIISKERSRLQFDLVDLPMEPEDFPAFVVCGILTISGTTQAAVRKASFRAIKYPINEDVSFPEETHEMLGVPSVIRIADTPIEVRNFIVSFDGFKGIFSGADIIYAKGAIHYTDVFKGRWVFRFSRRHKFPFYEDGRILASGGWEKYGEETDNGEYPDE